MHETAHPLSKTYRAGQFPLPVAQFLRLRERIPPLYGLLSVNAAILGYTHWTIAPVSLTLIVPSVLIAACLMRMFAWLRVPNASDFDPELALRRMQRTTVIAVFMALAFVAWALWLDQYGGPYEHGHVAIFVAVTVLGCTFCLTFLPTAATLVCVTVLSTFLCYSMIKGPFVQVAIAINIALVAIVILKILRDTYDSFIALENTQHALANERRQAQALSEENARLAETDALTGLPNRRYFFARLEGLLANAGSEDVFCVGLIDLDRFKPVNDTYGHAQGDRLLHVLGERILAAIPDDAVMARLGGDEFGIIVQGPLEEAEAVTQALCAEIRRPARIADIVVSVGCSAGLADYPASGRNAHDLFDRADFALYHAKNEKRGQCVRFSSKLEQMIRTEQALDAALQTADLTRELSVVFQPIVATETRTPIGVECLARWHSASLGSVNPELLIATAERLGRAREVTLALFGRALDALAQLPQPMTVCFNLSGQDISDAETIAALIALIERSGISASRLVFEITETSLISKFDSASEALEGLREIGARIALDDFGTGYSSLSALHQLPLDMVKIDRSFAPRLDETRGRRLIAAIRNLARSLSLDCVIEGIETEDQLLSARIAGFTLAQGYYMAMPMPLPELLERYAGIPNSSFNAA
ncbi:bifunctional diguanylate cyclase/phosphodiesterase [Novosphingobium sp. KA1]|uniref:putative bifunctional diguanylate cyclase/phosphodiesterase n=1 Tax=Novosphingobium sp. (strain KA1) TaxID=164608 RepID=UPI001A8EE7DD|nr:EAL domain-containing protein [Novosphingobium sp. KA1]